MNSLNHSVLFTSILFLFACQSDSGSGTGGELTNEVHPQTNTQVPQSPSDHVATATSTDSGYADNGTDTLMQSQTGLLSSTDTTLVTDSVGASNTSDLFETSSSNQTQSNTSTTSSSDHNTQSGSLTDSGTAIQTSVAGITNTTTSTATTTQQVIVDEASGAQWFAQLCVQCHSVDGQQGLVAINWNRFADQRQLVDYTIEQMPPAPSFNVEACSEFCAEAVIAYLTQENQLFSEEPLANNVDLAAAKAMYVNKEFAYCDTCHQGTNGQSVKILDGQGKELREFNWQRFSGVESMRDYIKGSMPLNDEHNCTDDNQCATLTAQYLYSVRHVVDPIVSSDGKQLFTAYCSACHRESGEGSRSLQDFGDGYYPIRFKAGLDQSDPSYVLFKTQASFVDHVGLTMPPGDASVHCQQACAQDIADYLWQLNQLSQDQQYSCEQPNYLPKQIRLLTRKEYQNSLQDIFDYDASALVSHFPLETGGHNFSNDVASATVGSTHVQEYWNAAKTIAKEIVTQQHLTSDCDLGQSQCQNSTIEQLGLKLFRRPLNEQEIVRYSIAFDQTYNEGDNDISLRMILQSMLSSPMFLYRTEIGELLKFDAPLEGGDLFLLSKSQYSTTGNPIPIGDYMILPNAAQVSLDYEFTEPGKYGIAAELGQNQKVMDLTFKVDGEFVSKVKTRELGFEYFTLGQIAVNEAGSQTLTFASTQGQYDLKIQHIRVVKLEPEVEETEDVAEIAFLTPYETASYLSYTFTGSTPDELLLQAAADNQLQTPQQLSTQVQRLLDTERGQQQMTYFFAQWFGADRIMDLSRNYPQFSAFTDDIRQSMKQEFDLFIQHVIEQDLPLAELYDADYSFMNQALLDYYQIDQQVTQGFDKVPYADAPRRGVVTMGAVIASQAKGDENSPVRRGMFVREDLLCQTVPSPPDISGQGGEFDPTLPIRQRLAQHSNVASCASCHKTIDDLGFAFENYNGIGQYKTQEYIPTTDQTLRGSIDASGVLHGVEHFFDGDSQAFDNALQLIEVLSNTEAIKHCALEKWQVYSTGRSQKLACQEQHLFDAWQNQQFSLRQLLIESVKVPHFLTRQ